MDLFSFEETIKKYIRQSERSQAATARLLKVAPDTFNKWIRGVNRIPIDVLHEFCELLKLDEKQRRELYKLAGHVVPPVVTEEATVIQSPTENDEPSHPVPLPAKLYRDLIGRETIIDKMLAALRDPAGKRILAIDGMGGIGKTALAHGVADRSLAEQLFDTTIWVQAPREEFSGRRHTNKTGTLTFDTVLNTVARQLGASGLIQLKGASKEARVRTLLEMQRVLIVLDNLETAKDSQNEIARRLLPLLGTSKAILTSRQRFQGDLYAIHLTGLDEEGSLNFIRQEAEEKNINWVVMAKVIELKPIAQDTGGSPLAMKLVVGQLEALDLETVLSLLREIQIPEQGSEEDDYFRLYQNIFFSSWKLLSEESQMLLISIAHFVPGIGGTLKALQATSDLTNPTLVHCIRELWRFSFLEVGESPNLKEIRYYLHALTNYFVLADIVKVI